MHLAGQLLPTGAPRLERLRGFGAQLGNLATCACAQLEFSDGSAGILIAAVAPVGRTLPLAERLQRLVEDLDTPIAAFASDGSFVGASSAARPLLGFRNLAEAGLDHAPNKANGIKLIEWLAGEQAQQMYADANYEYPIRSGVAINPTIAGYGKLNADPLPIAKIAANRKAASTLVDKVGFDN